MLRSVQAPLVLQKVLGALQGSGAMGAVLVQPPMTKGTQQKARQRDKSQRRILQKPPTQIP
jgi:hypothetical protein